MMVEQELFGYQQAWESAAYFQPPAAGSQIVRGEDREAFLQRQTTNDIRRLKPGTALLTVLTSPTARILDVLYLLPEGEQIQALSMSNKAGATASFLKSRIFFMDKVSVQDTSADLAQLYLVGPDAPRRFTQAFKVPHPSIDQVIEFRAGEVQARYFAAHPAILPGGVLIAPVAALNELSARLENEGAARLSPDAWEAFRIETGLPGPQTELSEAYNPLEVGLFDAVSDSKGCYTGQEIIARQITYDKITQHLRKLRLEKLIEPGAQIRADGKRAGVLSSAVESPRFGPVGLAVLKRPYHEPGTMVELQDADGSLVYGRVVESLLE